MNQVNWKCSNPTPDEGDWSLTLTISNRNDRISGMAQAMVSSGRLVEFRVRGSYSPSDDTCKFVLRGIGDAAGVVMHLTTDGQMNLTSLRGKFFGQELALPSVGP